MYINFNNGNFFTVCDNYTTPTLDHFNGKPCIAIPEYDINPDFRRFACNALTSNYGIDAQDANTIDYRLAVDNDKPVKPFVLYVTVPGANKSVAYHVSMLPAEIAWLVERLAVVPVLTAEIRAEIELEAAKNNPVALAKYLRKRFTAWTVAANPDLAKLFRLNDWMESHVDGVLKLWQGKIGFYLPEE